MNMREFYELIKSQLNQVGIDFDDWEKVKIHDINRERIMLQYEYSEKCTVNIFIFFNSNEMVKYSDEKK